MEVLRSLKSGSMGMALVMGKGAMGFTFSVPWWVHRSPRDQSRDQGTRQVPKLEVPYVRYISGDVPKKSGLIWYSSCSLRTRYLATEDIDARRFSHCSTTHVKGKELEISGDQKQVTSSRRPLSSWEIIQGNLTDHNGVLQWIQHKDAMITQNWHDIWDIWDVLNQQKAGNCCGFRFEPRFSGPPKVAHGEQLQLGTVLLQSLTSPGQKSSPGMSWDSVQTFQSLVISILGLPNFLYSPVLHHKNMEVSEILLIPKRIIFHNWSTIIFHHIYGGFHNYTIYFPPFFPSLLVHDGSFGQLPELRPPPKDCGLANGTKIDVDFISWKNLYWIWSPVYDFLILR